METSLTKREKWAEEVQRAHIPTYFKALLFEAASQKCVTTVDGGSFQYDYSVAGHELARQIEDYLDGNELDELDLSQWRDPVCVDAWLKRHMNGFYRLVPAKRRKTFIRGFIEMLDEG